MDNLTGADNIRKEMEMVVEDMMDAYSDALYQS